jgi:hypothetical protein
MHVYLLFLKENKNQDSNKHLFQLGHLEKYSHFLHKGKEDLSPIRL